MPYLTSTASRPIFTIVLMGRKISCFENLKPRQPVTVKPVTLFSGKVNVKLHTLPRCAPSVKFITSFCFNSLKVTSIFYIIYAAGIIKCPPHNLYIKFKA